MSVESSRRYYAANRAKVSAQEAARYHENRGARLAQRRFKKFGINQAAFTDLLASQGGKCAICQAPKPGGKGGWHLDHDHRFDQRDPRGHRGLLCHHCNVGLGCFKDSLAILGDAAEYLAGHALQLRLAAMQSAA